MILRTLLAVLALTGTALAQPSAQQQARIERLEKSLLAPCCYSEPVLYHRSEIALAMKAEIERMVAEGASDAAILDMYKKRYGLKILVEPEGRLWWWMNAIPIIALAIGVLLAVHVLRKWLRPLPAS
jgi:cytochrome c-type biogenesis protein CcmH/NrfF